MSASVSDLGAERLIERLYKHCLHEHFSLFFMFCFIQYSIFFFFLVFQIVWKLEQKGLWSLFKPQQWQFGSTVA